MDQLATLKVIDDGANGNLQNDVVASLPGAVRAFAVAAALRIVLGIEAEVDQRVVRLARFHDDVAAAPAIAAARSTARNELLPAEGNAAVAAVAGLDADFRFINEHS